MIAAAVMQVASVKLLVWATQYQKLVLVVIREVMIDLVVDLVEDIQKPSQPVPHFVAENLNQCKIVLLLIHRRLGA